MTQPQPHQAPFPLWDRASVTTPRSSSSTADHRSISTAGTERSLRAIIRDIPSKDLKVILHAVHSNLAQEIATEISRRLGAI